MRVLVIGAIFDGLGAGADVNFEMVKAFSKLGFEVTLQVPTFVLHRAVFAYLSGSKDKQIENPLARLIVLEKFGIHVPNYIKVEIESILRDYSEKKLGYEDIISYLFLWRSLQKDKTISRKLISSRNFDLVLAMNEIFPVFKCAINASKLDKSLKCIIMFHTEPFTRDSAHTIKINGHGFRSEIRNIIAKHNWEKAIDNNTICGIWAASMAPILISGLESKILKSRIPVYIPDPPWCIPEIYYNSRSTKDKKGVIFISRLVEDKGIFEIPEIVKSIHGKQLTLVGDFTKEQDKKRFFELSSKAGISVKYLGFVDSKQVPVILSQHKVLLYPSHADSYSRTMVQAITVGTSVVAYDIPAFSLIYGGLSSVSIVKEGDVESMAFKANQILQMGDKDYSALHDSEPESAFILKFKDCYGIWKKYGTWLTEAANIPIKSFAELKI